MQHLFGVRKGKEQVQLKQKGAASGLSSILVKLDCQCASFALRTMKLLNSSVGSLYSLKADCAIPLHKHESMLVEQQHQIGLPVPNDQ